MEYEDLLIICYKCGIYSHTSDGCGSHKERTRGEKEIGLSKAEARNQIPGVAPMMMDGER